MFRTEAEFTAWVESVEAWIAGHIDRHHNSSGSDADHLPARVTVEPDVHEEVEPSETISLPTTGAVTVGTVSVEHPAAAVEQPAA